MRSTSPRFVLRRKGRERRGAEATTRVPTNPRIRFELSRLHFYKRNEWIDFERRGLPARLIPSRSTGQEAIDRSRRFIEEQVRSALGAMTLRWVSRYRVQQITLRKKEKNR